MIADAFLQSAVRTATPLALAALGEVVVERAGIINIGLEGVMLGGAFGALLGAGSGSVGVAFLVAILAGVVLAAAFAFVVVQLRGEQIITGTAINLLALGLTGTLYESLYGAQGAALTIPTIGPAAIPFLSSIPLIGPALFAQPWPTYALYVLTIAVWWWMYRTHAGLALRAVGERAEAAAAAGISPARMQWGALLFGGALGGLGGAVLVVAQAGTFAEGMTAGRGFIAIAIVALGRWKPIGSAIAALFFGAAIAAQFVFQAMGWRLPYQLFLALPYIVTLVALAVRGALGARRARLV